MRALAPAKSQSLLRRLSFNTVVLLASSLVSGLFGILTLGAVARGLQPAAFGAFVLITAYSTLINRVFGFQSWQPLVTFGCQPDCAEPKRRAHLFGIGLTLDAMAAVFAALVGLAATPVAASLLKLDGGGTTLLAIATLVNATALAGMPTAVLRIYDRHSLYSLHAVVSAAGKLLVVGATALITRDLLTCVWAWAATHVASNLALLGLGTWVAKGQGALNHLMFASPSTLRTFPGLTKSFWETNLIQTAKVFREGDVLVIGGLLGHEASGLFKIARQLGDVMIKATDPLLIALFPEFARLNGKANLASFSRLLWRSTAVVALGAAVGVLSFAVAGKWLIALLFGESFIAALPLLLLCVTATAIRVSGQAPSAALLAARRSRDVLIAMVVSGLIYYGLIYLAARSDGVAAGSDYVWVGAALIVGNLMMVGSLFYISAQLFLRHSGTGARP